MTIWADADSLPRDLRQILVRRERSEAQKRAGREETTLSGGSSPPAAPDTGKNLIVLFVSSKRLPELPHDMTMLVEPGPDAVDSFIEARACSGDLVVTRDIAFAARAAAKGVTVLNDKGAIFTSDTISERRSLRDAAEELRFQGLVPPSPRGSGRSPADTKKFADALDGWLAKALKRT
jgi:uncharacterized protein YaiI (UPF0178 family)